MKVHCDRCDFIFERSTRNNKICSKCAKKSQKARYANRSYHTKKTSTACIHDRQGKFAGFITADNDDELDLIKLPRGYKRFGDVI